MPASNASKRLVKSFLVIPWRRLALYAIALLILCASYMMWSPGEDVTNSPHDLKTNGLWLQHGWVGDDIWYAKHGKADLKPQFRAATPTA